MLGQLGAIAAVALLAGRLGGPRAAVAGGILALALPVLWRGGPAGDSNVPYAALVVAAAAFPAATVPSAALLGVAGLLRPEAWGLAAIAGVLGWHRADGRERLATLASVIVPPVLWLGLDRVFTGDALWSQHVLDRYDARFHPPHIALGDLATTLVHRVDPTLGWPLLVLAVVALGVSLARRPIEPAAAFAVALGALLVVQVARGAVTNDDLGRMLTVLALLGTAGGAALLASLPGRALPAVVVVLCLAFVAVPVRDAVRAMHRQGDAARQARGPGGPDAAAAAAGGRGRRGSSLAGRRRAVLRVSPSPDRAARGGRARGGACHGRRSRSRAPSGGDPRIPFVVPVSVPSPPATYQELIARLQDFWMTEGCVVMQPYHTEVGAGTFNPATFLRCLDSRPWRVAYVEPSIRPADGRYGENPYRFGHYYQYQVLLKPSPDDVLETYVRSLEALGVDPRAHDLRFVEDNWEGPTLGAWGAGWEVWLDGMEVTQFTYFQQVGGLDLDPISVELTYGLERLAMYLQGVESAFDVIWAPGVTWGDVYREYERQWSIYNFEVADTDVLQRHFEDHERECARCLEASIPLAAYDQVLKCSHAFNLLDARGAISVTDRVAYIGRVRNLARRVAQAHLAMVEPPVDA